MPRAHRHRVLPDAPLQPTRPIPDVELEVQADHMQELRQLHNNIAQGYWLRDDRMAAFAVSNTLSREDMAIATGLAKSRIDQILREVAEGYRERRENAARERMARHGPQ